MQNALEHQAIADLFAPFAATNDAQNVKHQTRGEQCRRNSKENCVFSWLAPFLQKRGHFIVDLSRAVVALRQIRHGVNRRSGRAELRVIAKQVHIAFEVLFFFLHRGEQLQCGARIVDGAVGVLCFELIGVHGVAELM